ncbi:MAG: 50S ribosomal protein L17 [bacterium]|nr:50S ribosomal protein L17 [bacterium]
MRHAVSGTKFNVDKDHRASLLRNLVTSLITHEEIVTSEAKAKALKQLFDRVITRAKKDNIQARRLVATYVHGQASVAKLFVELLPRLASRNSGYTTTELLVKTRAGDRSRQMKIKILLDEVKAPIEEEKKVVKKPSAKKAVKKDEESI